MGVAQGSGGGHCGMPALKNAGFRQKKYSMTKPYVSLSTESAIPEKQGFQSRRELVCHAVMRQEGKAEIQPGGTLLSVSFILVISTIGLSGAWIL